MEKRRLSKGKTENRTIFQMNEREKSLQRQMTERIE